MLPPADALGKPPESKFSQGLKLQQPTYEGSTIAPGGFLEGPPLQVGERNQEVFQQVQGNF